MRYLQAIDALEAGLSVQQIAYDLGYSTPSAFIAMFQAFDCLTRDSRVGCNYSIDSKLYQQISNQMALDFFLMIWVRWDSTTTEEAIKNVFIHSNFGVNRNDNYQRDT